MMEDRELLELAAKAAGFDSVASVYGWDEVTGSICLDANDPPELWNPLMDDGDALRLAVKCGIRCIDIILPRDALEIGRTIAGSYCSLHGNDPCAATRRAIVRAAARIGAAIPQT